MQQCPKKVAHDGLVVYEIFQLRKQSSRISGFLVVNAYSSREYVSFGPEARIVSPFRAQLP